MNKILEMAIVISVVFIFFFVISFFGCYFRFPNIKDGKRSLLPSKKAFKKALGTGFWGTVVSLAARFLMLLLSNQK